MKKVTLLFLSFAFVVTVVAQGQNEIKDDTRFAMPKTEAIDVVLPERDRAIDAFNKKTVVSEWYNFVDLLDETVGASLSASAPYLFIDTFVQVGYTQSGTFSEFGWARWTSFGSVFDPRDPLWDANQSANTRTFSKYNKYTLDSVAFYYFYDRVAEPGVVDTLVLQVWRTGIGSWFYSTGGEVTERFGTVEYNINTGLGRNATRTMKIPLTINDTATAGLRRRAVAINDLSIDTGGLVAVAVTYLPGTVHSFGDTIGRVSPTPITKRHNSFRMYMVADQDANPFLYHNNGIVIQYEQRYNPQWLQSTTQGARYLAGTAFLSTLYPYISFHVTSQNVGIGDDNKYSGYNLGKAYPNPARVSENINIEFTIANRENVEIELHNLLGQKVMTIASDDFNAGTHNVSFSTAKLNSGMYFYTMKAGGFSKSYKLNLSK